MPEEPDDRRSALDVLRTRLEEGRARSRLNQQQLATKAVLGRSTVSKALTAKGGVPSKDTVSRLAHALRLPVGELLEMRRAAAEESGTASPEAAGPGRPVGQWDPHDLEIHPAGPEPIGSASRGLRVLPAYVRREHDRILDDAVAAAAAGHSRIVLLVGSSSTGKTRACWQAVQRLPEGWRLWHPFDPTRAEAALENLRRVGPRTVVWLNEAQHYLGDRDFGERIVAAVHHLLLDEQRGPVLVLGTLWPEYAHDYTALPKSGEADRFSQVRELLAGATVSVPDHFDAAATAAAATLAEQGDLLLADALARSRDSGRITQDLAGAPELLRRYEQPGRPAARALLEAAMDARRLGVGLHLAQSFLTAAAPGYLSEPDYDQLTEDWDVQAYAELAEPVHGKQAPLRRTALRPARRPPAPTAGSPAPEPTGPVFRLADYLEQHGRTARRRFCPPATFWHAAHTQLTRADDLNNLARAAQDHYRLEWSHHLRRRAAALGSTDALYVLAMRREEAGDREGAEDLYQRAADLGSTRPLYILAVMREEAGDRDGAEDLARRAADLGNTHPLYVLAVMWEEAGDREGAEDLYWRAADLGNTDALHLLAMRRETAGEHDGAEDLARRAADLGSTDALYILAMRRETAGDRDAAEDLHQRAADLGSTLALHDLAVRREKAGDRDGAEDLARRTAALGKPGPLHLLAVMREEAGDRDGAEDLARRAADLGNTDPLYALALTREKAGDREGAEDLYRRAADLGAAGALHLLAVRREEAGDRDGAEDLARRAADLGATGALHLLAVMREEAGDRDGAEDLAQRTADLGNTNALYVLAQMRLEAGDHDGARDLYRQVADFGEAGEVHRAGPGLKVLWPYGLDPDGTATRPWQPSPPVAER
ncbi:helix-turn-helix domain-containing protein [Streptomyces sp. NPDC088785]|uniref:helix-turn-helix domain-containing protein n=1 Tax=Streptomyces sp. NPDC088785 TaxID=3365897 RepID=UPI0037F980D8